MNTGKEERREVARRHAFAHPALLMQPGAQPGHADPAQVLHRPARKPCESLPPPQKNTKPRNALRRPAPPLRFPRFLHALCLEARGDLSIRPLFRAQAFASLATQLIFNDSALVPARRSPPALSFTSRFSFLQQSRPDTDSRPGPFPRRSPRSAPSLCALSIKPADNQPLKINIFLFFPALLFSGIDVQKS